MILALEEDGILRVYDSPEIAARQIEALDAEATFRALFDEQARPYVIEWVRPNHFGPKVFGLLQSCENGAYRLVPSGPPNAHALLEAVRAAAAIEPQSAKPSVCALAERLARHQVQ